MNETGTEKKTAGSHYCDGWRDALTYLYQWCKSWETFEKFKACHISPHMSEKMQEGKWYHDSMEEYENSDKSITFDEFLSNQINESLNKNMSDANI